MISGNLLSLHTSGLPSNIKSILLNSKCSFEALCNSEDGRLSVEGEEWFCNIGDAQTQEPELRHTEFHYLYADIQVVLEGEEIINYGVIDCSEEAADEKKPDLLILKEPKLTQSVHLKPGDFAVFMPGEAHQALCMVSNPEQIRKAVFKVPLSILED